MIQDMDSTKLHLHTQRLYDWQQGKDIGPIHIDLGINNSCNNRCKHCYLGHTKHPNVQLPVKIMPQLFDDMKTLGVKSVFFAGSGEPMLHPRLIHAMQMARLRNLDVALATNGIVASYHGSEACEAVLYAAWIRLSIQGASVKTYKLLHGLGEKGEYLAWHSLALLVKCRNDLSPSVAGGLSCKIGVLTCLMPENLSEIKQMAVMAKACGADYFTVRPASGNPDRPLQAPVWKIDDIREQLEEAEAVADENFQVIVRWNLFKDQQSKPYGQCLGLPFIMQIDADGSCYSCGSFVGNESYCYGNLHEQSLVEIWNSDRRKEVMNRVMNTDFAHCDSLCRLHNINQFLWGLKHPPEHVNFI